MRENKKKSPSPISELTVVGDGEVPLVENRGSILQLARRLGELAPRLPLFELNGELVYYNHRRQREVMTGRVFRGWVEEHVFVVGGYDQRSGNPTAGSLSLGDAMDVLVQPAFRYGVRQMVGEEVVRLPVIRDSGELELLPWGYDKDTGVYTVPGGLEYGQETDVAMAKKWLAEILGDFPFSDERSMAAQVASMLALYVRHMLPDGGGLRPGFLWRANRAGSGKSVLAKLPLHVVFGHAAVSKMKRGEELDKELEAFMRAAVPYIFLDNVYGSIASASIDQLMTSEESTGRAMGGHGVFRAKNTAQLLVTGNQLEWNEDAERRFCLVDLFEPEDPRDRSVAFPLSDAVMRGDDFRRKTLEALWALVSHWVQKGRPKPQRVLPTFEDFTALVGGIVTCAGYDEPFERSEFADEMTPERAELHDLIRLVIDDMRKPIGEAVGEETPAQNVRKYKLPDFVVMARSKGLFADIVGNSDDGRRMTIKNDGLKGELASYAEDQGYLTMSQRSKFSLLLAKFKAQKFVVDGQRLKFGERGRTGDGRFYNIELL
jgi:hypothetical protein